MASDSHSYTTISSRAEAVARIAYLASQVIVSVQPALDVDSSFSSHLKSLAAKRVPSLVGSGSSQMPGAAPSDDDVPDVIPVRFNADPLLCVFTPARTGQLVSVTTTTHILIPSIPHLYKLVSFPIVLHVSLERSPALDYSSITSIRTSGWTIIQSRYLREAQDMALSAHALAVRSGKGVIHFFDATGIDAEMPIHPTDTAVMRQILNIAAPPTISTPQTSSPGDPTSAPLKSPDISKVDRPDSPVSRQSTVSMAQQSAISSATTVESRPPVMTSTEIHNYITTIWARIHQRGGAHYHPFELHGPENPTAVVFHFGPHVDLFLEALLNANQEISSTTALVTARLYRPWIVSQLLDLLPSSVQRIAVAEQVPTPSTTRWGPLFLDVLTAVKGGPDGRSRIMVGYQISFITPSTARQALQDILDNLRLDNPIQNCKIGGPEPPDLSPDPYVLIKPKLETAYDKILLQVFGSRAFIANSLKPDNAAGVSGTIAASPEYGLGSLLAREEHRQRFLREVKDAAANQIAFLTQNPNRWLAKWLAHAESETGHSKTADDLAGQVISCLEQDNSALSRKLLVRKSFLYCQSLWLIGSDAWAYDLGNSGVHHLLASGQNVNMLIIDSTPYSERVEADAERRKKDIGLYSMNFGNAYVASVAVYSSYTQVLQAMEEADRFNGPSIVLAYLPYYGEHDSPLVVLQETKKAVDLGYWPLYRWNPDYEANEAKGGEPKFQLDSERIKKELQTFLDRDNHLTLLMNNEPQLGASLALDYGTEIRQHQKRKAKDAYQRLLEGLHGAPLTILYASDNGNAESLARRLGTRGRARGLKTTVMAMEDYPVEDLVGEENIILITSTAGQGEFPQNGRPFWDAIKSDTSLDLVSVRYSIFGLGDSHYWPRAEDQIYYNKPAKDLDRKMADLGAERFADLGLGDDQAADGYQTGYSLWEPKVWEALGVSKVGDLPEEPPPLTNEDIKRDSNFLRGTIAEGLRDTTTGTISAADQQLTKFHGTYMQDDRDVREERKAQGLEPAYSFMIRCRLPGGVATPTQWLQMDDISTQLGNETMKLTTRQTFQFHGVVKGKVKPAMQAINRALMTTLAACGDVNRNVMCSPLPAHSQYHHEVYAFSQKISDHLLPSTSAYHEIWLMDVETNKKTQVAGNALQDFEPLYGPTYLPRKFKIAIAIPPHNDTDIYAHDIGLIAIKGEDGHLAGFNLLAGGGMGATHNNKKTYPQTGRMLGFVPSDDVHVACEKVMLVQRDHGDRQNRKHARLKYTIDDMGLDTFRSKVEELWSQRFAVARPFHFESNVDTFGWQRDEAGWNHFTLFIENGRVEDTADFPMKTGLREIARTHRGEFRLTPNQHLILSNVADADLAHIKALLAQHKLDNLHFSGLRLSSSACVAFPTCGLAMAESERYLPQLISKLEQCLEETGLGQESIVMRMTGCPNGCARPWLAEVAFVGKAYGAYNMYLGGGYHGQRLGKLYRSSIREEEMLAIMKSLLKRYAIEREEGERFGDWTIRADIIKETKDGRDFHEGVAEEAAA